MKPSPFQWAKISKEVHSISDVITAAYVNQENRIPTEDPNDDFGTADLTDDGNSHVIDALKYVLSLPPGLSLPILGDRIEVGDRIIHNKSHSRTCTCGAQKTYGPTCSKSFHSSWCDLNDRT